MGEDQASVHTAVPSAVDGLNGVEPVIDGDFDVATAVRLLAREVRDLRERVGRLEHEDTKTAKTRSTKDAKG